MYFDRTLRPELAALLTGPLRWLLDAVRGPWGAANRAHLQSRKNRGTPGGWLQLYTANESPLCLECLPGRRPPHSSRFRFFALEGASRPAPPPIVRANWRARGLKQPGVKLTVPELATVRGQLEPYLHAAALNNESFDIEGRLTAGLARSRGLLATEPAPFLVLDTEARVGFDSMSARRDYLAQLAAHGLGRYQELDVLGLLPDGRLLAVEVKVSRADLQLAARQVATYQRQLRDVRARGDLTPQTIHAWVHQKESCGLLARGVAPAAADGPPVPAIALPDDDPGWLAHWRQALAPSRALHPVELAGLRLYRLSPDGRVLDEATA